MEYLFIPITLKFSLTQSGITCFNPNYGSNRLLLLFVFDRIMCTHTHTKIKQTQKNENMNMQWTWFTNLWHKMTQIRLTCHFNQSFLISCQNNHKNPVNDYGYCSTLSTSSHYYNNSNRKRKNFILFFYIILIYSLAALHVLEFKKSK